MIRLVCPGFSAGKWHYVGWWTDSKELSGATNRRRTMTKRYRLAGLLALLAVVALLAFMMGPAMAHHKDGHEQGRGNDEASQQEIPDDDDDNAHPSGKDRETNNGPEDDTQGHSESNPDNDGHGPERNSCEGSGVDECADKAGGDGGVDTDDQDGNNGCGNDDDFEDDKEGWCGKPETSVDTEEVPDIGAGGGGAEIGGIVLQRFPSMPSAELPTQVLGVTLNQAQLAAGAQVEAAQAGVLPFTGGPIAGVILLGLGLIIGGAMLHRARVR